MENMSRVLVIEGKVWKFGDDLNTDIIIPGRYLTITDPEKLVEYTFQDLDPDLSKKMSEGDIVVGGKNFGCGSSREQAPLVLKTLGIGAVVAESFARIFFRNSINLGLPVVECPGISSAVENGQQLRILLEEGRIENLNTGDKMHGTKLPAFLIDIIRSGGAVAALNLKMKERK
jgi:3-isopropylmalate/(R)-2-methylmalate dehydratase small subunit